MKDEQREELKGLTTSAIAALKVADDALERLADSIPGQVEKLDGASCECECESLLEMEASIAVVQHVMSTYAHALGHRTEYVLTHDDKEKAQRHMQDAVRSLVQNLHPGEESDDEPTPPVMQ